MKHLYHVPVAVHVAMKTLILSRLACCGFMLQGYVGLERCRRCGTLLVCFRIMYLVGHRFAVWRLDVLVLHTHDADFSGSSPGRLFSRCPHVELRWK